ncbi:hypothetical protein K443DRAFT_511681 [Laccaria amethystina LaAM-08-1]|uniref:Uncharacterized protein n=1 Tax=Laccaria amethystina LaAM-08-1 TaxID=1095629 RepID=A0A0C9XM79_9AGAR|nr:hypothetical protein K443DRAFT_511681 [Laccaria amethystina LaAM-08-1]
MNTEVQTPTALIHKENALNWFHRPPITPYDISVLLTTIVVGIAKALTTADGATIASTTLEWVGGVLIFLVLYVIGWYKSHEPKARWMEWFFNTESHHFPHNLRKPTLDSINGINEPPALGTKDTPIVTGNRIFVTVSVVGFGMSKAIVTYHGLPTSANTLDWVFAIVISSLTYCLEMYQDEAPSAWPSVFQTDYQPLIYSAPSFLGIGFRFLIGLYVIFFWVVASGYSIVFLWNRVPETPPTILLPPFLDYIHFNSCKILLACLATIILGLLPTMMEPFNPFTTFTFTWGLIWHVVLGYVTRFPDAVPPTITSWTIWRFPRRSFKLIAKVLTEFLISVGLLTLFQTALVSLSKSALARRIIQIYNGMDFFSSLRLVFRFILAVVSFISPIGLWIPTRALHTFIPFPFTARFIFTITLIIISIWSGGTFVWMLVTILQTRPSERATALASLSLLDY